MWLASKVQELVLGLVPEVQLILLGLKVQLVPKDQKLVPELVPKVQLVLLGLKV